MAEVIQRHPKFWVIVPRRDDDYHSLWEGGATMERGAITLAETMVAELKHDGANDYAISQRVTVHSEETRETWQEWQTVG